MAKLHLLLGIAALIGEYFIYVSNQITYVATKEILMSQVSL